MGAFVLMPVSVTDASRMSFIDGYPFSLLSHQDFYHTVLEKLHFFRETNPMFFSDLGITVTFSLQVIIFATKFDCP